MGHFRRSWQKHTSLHPHALMQQGLSSFSLTDTGTILKGNIDSDLGFFGGVVLLLAALVGGS